MGKQTVAVTMDNLKELLAPKTFNKVSHAAVVIWILIGIIFLGIFADAENGESRYDFRCGGAKSEKIDLVRGKCFELYEKKYNKHALPTYGFVIMNFFLIGTVCVIYSKIVSPTVDQLSPSARNGDLERQSPDQERAGKKLFIAYCCQLFTRIVLGVLFMVLQTQILYPLDFPSSFSCYLTSEGNSTGVIQNSKTLHECHNQRATKKNSWMCAVLVVNGIFLSSILMETVYIFLRAWREDTFMKNSSFLEAHLNIPHLLSKPEQFQETLLQEFIANTKKVIKEETNKPPQLRSPFSSTPGEGHSAKHLTLDQIYTKLVVVPDRAEYDFSGDRWEKLAVYARSGEKNITPRGLEDIINNEDRKVLIVGRPGIGKTLCCSKILRDWAFNKVFLKNT